MNLSVGKITVYTINKTNSLLTSTSCISDFMFINIYQLSTTIIYSYQHFLISFNCFRLNCSKLRVLGKPLPFSMSIILSEIDLTFSIKLSTLAFLFFYQLLLYAELTSRNSEID